MQIPKDCKQVGVALAAQAAIADKASDAAGKTKLGLARTSDILSDTSVSDREQSQLYLYYEYE